MATELTRIVQIEHAPYVTITLAAAITGLSEKAIRRKIEVGKWLEGREYRRSPDGGIFVSIDGYRKWVEGGPTYYSTAQTRPGRTE